MLGMMLGPLPQWVDADVFYATLFTTWQMYCPRKSGRMADSCDYEVYGQECYVWSDCIYSAYQNYETSYAGWFTEELKSRYNNLLATWKQE